MIKRQHAPTIDLGLPPRRTELIEEYGEVHLSFALPDDHYPNDVCASAQRSHTIFPLSPWNSKKYLAELKAGMNATDRKLSGVGGGRNSPPVVGKLGPAVTAP